jgi:hypothetical protein
MSEPDAVPLPREGEVFFDVRGEARCMRLSWYADSAVAVFSIWQGNRCTGTFRLPFGDLDRMVRTLQAGPYRHGGNRYLPDYDPPNYSTGHDPPGNDPLNYGSAPYYGNQASYGNASPYDPPNYGNAPHREPPDYRSTPRHAGEPAQWLAAHSAPLRREAADDTAPEPPFGPVPVPPDRGASTYHSGG